MKINTIKRSVTTELFFTYFLGYIILSLIILFSNFCSFVSYGVLSSLPTYTSSFEKLDNKLKDDYKSVTDDDLSDVNGFLIKINSKNQIDYTKGNVISEFKNITLESYMSIFGVKKNNLLSSNNDFRSFVLLENFNNTIIDTNSNEKYSLYSKYINQDNSLLLVGFPYSEATKTNFITSKISHKGLLKIIVSINILFVIAIIYIFAKITSKSFVKPIKILLNGVVELTKGNYNVRINMKQKNEFLELSNGFNIMAETIQDEKREKEKLEALRENLILDVSHDLKNPLSSILGYSEILIKNSYLTEDEKTDYLKVINRNSYRANKLITDLFELSLYENCNYNLNLLKVNICEFLRETIALYIPEFDNNEFKYNFNISESPFYALIDEQKFSRAINNTLDNIIKYNSKGTKISIKTYIKDNNFYILLSDNGIGIPKEYQSTIFNAFVRVDKSRNSNTGGTGLGLSITKKILNKHNGDITIVDSELGTTFEIVLPLI
ncbi:sensor histidine kinase [Clostridium uliginosum]|uniref:histidine kinase n=1 Tax=Clostridium uliginosum TaxID=119641 RepID=A0A1I1KBV0_9CLOT|nr:HAMP domain-containing sensor histidine kinase [Clostridium uliginosum]SFC58031.1 Signal transduction histidine kinase [Clostridium uliginosum]